MSRDLKLFVVDTGIQSAQDVFALAEQAGRLASRAEKMSAYDQATRTAIRQLAARDPAG